MSTMLLHMAAHSSKGSQGQAPTQASSWQESQDRWTRGQELQPGPDWEGLIHPMFLKFSRQIVVKQ